MNNLNGQRGITLIALVITIVVLIIITGISITKANDLANVAKSETIETNMLTIKAKAKEYIENVDSLNWALDDSNKNDEGLSTKEVKNREELQGEKYQLTLIEDETIYNNYSNWYEDGYTYYALGKEALDKMNLSSLWEEGNFYIIRYPLEDGDIENLEMDIINANGIKYKSTTYYKLSELEEVL